MRSWILQRVSAIFIALFVLYLGGFLFLNLPLDYVTWKAWVGLTFNKVVIILFFISVFFHAWVGIRDVIIDYVHSVALRFILLTGVIGILVSMAVWLLIIVQGA